MFINVAAFRDRSAWQWQPTLDAHDPSPPLVIGEETADPPGDVTLEGESVGVSTAAGELNVTWAMGGTSIGSGLTGAIVYPSLTLFPSEHRLTPPLLPALYPGSLGSPLNLTWALEGTSNGTSATGRFQRPSTATLPDTDLLPGVLPTQLEFAQAARPVSDVAAGGWVVAPLWSKLDEEVPSDADLVTGVCA